MAHPEKYEDLDDETKTKIQEWINMWLEPSDRLYTDYRCSVMSTAVRHVTSYGMKHDLQRMTGIYVYESVFREAMLVAGHRAKNTHGNWWCFYVSIKHTKCTVCDKKAKGEENFIHALCKGCITRSARQMIIDHRAWFKGGKIGLMPDRNWGKTTLWKTREYGLEDPIASQKTG